MMLIDTHAHLYLPEFDPDREQTIARAVQAGVAKMLMPTVDSTTHRPMLDLCRRLPGLFVPMMGVHPTSINDNPDWQQELETAERYLREGAREFCAIGEIGLDFHWDDRFRREQIEALRRQLDWALELDLPVAIHTREAWQQMAEVIESYVGRGLRGVFHAFGDTFDTYRRLRACGDFRFGIGGVVTFRNSRLAETVARMDLDDLVLETDCPYLTPAPHRGKRNEPAYLRFVCDAVARLKGLPPGAVARATTASACRLFGLDTPADATEEVGGDNTNTNEQTA